MTTVGVFLALGNTYTGHFDPVMDVAGELAKFESERVTSYQFM